MQQPDLAWYAVRNADQLDSPALLVYDDRVVSNIRLAIRYAGGAARLRPHTKTHKSPDVLRLFLQEGITKVKCASIAEAEIAGRARVPDVLLAYPVVGPKASRFSQLVAAYPASSFSCLVDSAISARELSVLARSRNSPIRVFIDVNVGQNRTGVAPEQAGVLWAACQQLEGLRPVGIHAYDGHNHYPDLSKRKALAERIERVVRTVLGEIQQTAIVVLGGSPSFHLYSQHRHVEVSPRTFVYWDSGYREHYPELAFDYGATLLTRVVSVGDDRRLCLDLGYKGVASENALGQRLRFLNHPNAVVIAQYEEHLVVEVADDLPHQPDDVWYAVPYHVCPTMNLYEGVFVVADNLATQYWKTTARNRMLAF